MAFAGSHAEQIPDKGIHAPISWTFANAAARLAFTPTTGVPKLASQLTSVDLCKFAFEVDTSTLFMLTSIGPEVWAAVAITVIPVQGPGVAVDEGVARWNGISGQLLQDSPVKIDDAGNLSGAGTYNGFTVGPRPAVQARRTTSLQLTALWQDVPLDVTDFESDAAILDHDLGANDDNILIKVSGAYEVWYAVGGQHNSIATEARIRINDATVIPGSFGTSGTDTHNQSHNYHVSRRVSVNLTANDFVTLQAWWDAPGGASPGLSSEAIFGVTKL